MKRQRSISLLVILAATVAAPAASQAADSAGAPGNSVIPGATAIPDFSGVWMHPYFPGIEPPAAGPGPVLNRSRRPDGVSNTRQFVGDYTNPILKPEAAEVVKRHGEMSIAGVTYPTPSNRCWPSGLPYIFFQVGVQVVQEPDRIVFLYFRDHEVRRVRLNGPHPAHLTPSWYGDSVGHYEGDTLVIDTVGIRTDSPFAMVDMYGTPYSAAMHVVERYRMIDYDEAQIAFARTRKENILISEVDFDPSYRGKHLQLQFTVDDAGVFTMPWSATITYARPLREWEEHVCPENIFDFYGSDEVKVPTASKPDF
jgi:hypothetical protein